MNYGNDILRADVLFTRTLERDWSRGENLRDLKVEKA